VADEPVTVRPTQPPSIVRRTLSGIALLPGIVWLAMFFIVPLAMMFVVSLGSRGAAH